MKNLKIYPQNIKKRLISLCLATTFLVTGLTSCSIKKNCNIEEEHYHIYKDTKEIEYTYHPCEYENKNQVKLKEYILKNDLSYYLIKNNLYETSKIGPYLNKEIEQLDTIYQKEVTTPKIGKDGKLILPEKWKLINEEQLKNYTGIIRQGQKEEIKYKIYTIKTKNGKYQKKSEVKLQLDQVNGEYIDIDNFIILENKEENRYNQGKKLCLK